VSHPSDDGYRPPPPGATATPFAPARTFNNAIPGQAGDVDPLAQSNDELPKDKTRADFRPEEFDRLILQHGKRIIWRKAMLCPCLRDETQQADLACTDCNGSGYFYVDPLEIQAVMAAFSASTRLYEKFGLWASGEVAVSTQAPYRLSWRDSLEMVDDLMSFNELIKKGNRRGRLRNLPANTDVARYRIAHMTKILVKTAASGSFVTLEQGIDFDLNDQGHIVWTSTGNSKVPDGTIVSVLYDFHPVWIVMSHPHAQRSDVKGFKESPDKIQPLPLQASAQLDFLQDSDRQLPVTGAC